MEIFQFLGHCHNKMYFPTGIDSLESKGSNKPSIIRAEDYWCFKRFQLCSMGFIIASYAILP